jgi:hypothetical protein
MISGMRKLFGKAGLVLLFISGYYNCFSQDAYMNLADTGKSGLFKNFLGVKIFAADFGATSLNQDLKFKYVSYNPIAAYTFQHDMNVKGINNFFDGGLGLEENLGKHLSINFFNTSIGYMDNAWDWNIGAGVGYFVSLDKQQTMRLNASLNVYFQSITYSFGNYYDSTGYGFVVDGVNVGTSIKNVKYVNTLWTLSPGIEFLYRRPSIDFFAGVYYNYTFSSIEKVNFYEHKIPISYAIFDESGNPVSQNAISLNKYFIQVGIIREFGL